MCLQPSFPGKWSIDEAYLLYVGLMFGELGNYTVISYFNWCPVQRKATQMFLDHLVHSLHTVQKSWKWSCVQTVSRDGHHFVQQHFSSSILLQILQFDWLNCLER